MARGEGRAPMSGPADGPDPEAAGFDVGDFLPYLLNQAAEEAGAGFQKLYKARYGLLRTEWRVLFHLGRHGAMTARDICDRSRTHKTKVSRAVRGLEARRFLTRAESEGDRRAEILSLTPAGRAAYLDLARIARDYDAGLSRMFTREEALTLRAALRRLAGT